jgi:hypothetical protein
MRFKLIDTPWDIDEQREMLPFPFVEWSWLIQYRVSYKPVHHDLEEFFSWVPYYEHGHYNAALLHLDLAPANHLNDRLARRQVYEELNGVIRDIPKIVIVHGQCIDIPEDLFGEIKDLIGGNLAVVSSEAVAEKLGVGYVIPPGINADHWIDLPKEPRIVTSLDRATSPDLQVIESFQNELAARDIVLCRIGADYIPNTWSDYRDFLGRSLFYFAHLSCSERMRAAAMLSGCCVLSPDADGRVTISNNTDINPYLVSYEITEMAKLIEEFCANPAQAIRVGQKAKRMARHFYDWGCYSREWLKYLNFHVWTRQSGL